MEKEIRQYSIEFKSIPESNAIEGRAIPFNIKSPNREGFRELVLPEAVEGVIEKSDIFLLYNHDKSQGFLARNKRGKGSLNIDVREDGVYFSFIPGNDNLSLYIKDRIERGDLDETSWAFTVESDTWVKGADGVYDRTITKFEELYDFSIVDRSYYGLENVVGCKRYAEILEEEKRETEEKLAELEEGKEKPAPIELKAIDTGSAAPQEVQVEPQVEEKSLEEPEKSEETAENGPENNEERSEEVVDDKAQEEITKDLTDYYNSIREEYKDYLKKE